MSRVKTATEIRQWAEEHGPFLDAVWRRFDSDGEWPEAGRLTRDHFSARPRISFLALAREMPPALGRPQRAKTVRSATRSSR